MTDMTAGLEMLMVCFQGAWIVDVSRVFTRRIRREDRMDDAAMDMTAVAMAMGCFRMHMEQGNHEHP